MNVAQSNSEQPVAAGRSPGKSFGDLLRMINNAVQKVFFGVIQPNRTYYYNSCHATNSPLILAVKNLLRPKRFLKKLAYGQVVPLPVALSKGEPLPAFTPTAEALRIFEQFKRDGIVVVPGRFRDIADHITAKYNITAERYKPAEDYQYDGDVYVRQLDDKILRFMVDELVLQVFGLYYGRQPYLRAPMQLSMCNPSYDSKPSREIDWDATRLNIGWHFDTPNMVQIAVLLNDVTEKDSHMQIAKGQHRANRIVLGKWDTYYSDEYVRDHCEVVPCVGPKGSIYFFDSNSMHRLLAVKDSPRFMIKIMFQPGNDILPVTHRHIDYRISMDGGLKLDGFTPLQKNALRFLV